MLLWLRLLLLLLSLLLIPIAQNRHTFLVSIIFLHSNYLSYRRHRYSSGADTTVTVDMRRLFFLLLVLLVLLLSLLLQLFVLS